LIRTWLRPDSGTGALHVGGGIVVDSDPEAEWQETLDKAAAFGDVVVT
jgi:anthranilate/para-aminobenzoate synthase component I